MSQKLLHPPIFATDISLQQKTLTLRDYDAAIQEAGPRGVMGGGIYDLLHATFARRKEADQLVARNPPHFRDVAPDTEILIP
jgi:hypothetical protein